MGYQKFLPDKEYIKELATLPFTEKKAGTYSESELTLLFCNECHYNKIRCEQQYRHEDCVFDCVIVHKDRIVAIIEVKRCKGLNTHPVRSYRRSKQNTKYNRYDVPVLIVASTTMVFGAIKWIKAHIEQRCI